MCYYKKNNKYSKESGPGFGSSLLKNKNTKTEIKKDKFILVNTINFSNYIITNFAKTDKIVLKIDIEGEEYNLLQDMIDTKSIEYIYKIYCEWHYKKMKDYKKDRDRYKKMHYNIVSQLNKLRFPLTGENDKDELCRLIERNLINIKDFD